MILQLEYIQENFVVWIRSFCIKSLKKNATQPAWFVESQQRGCSDLFIDLISCRLARSPTQLNNKYTHNRHVGQSVVSRSSPSPSRCTFTSAGRPSCPCRGPWRWNSVGKTEPNMRQWQSDAMLKTNRTERDALWLKLK